MIYVHIYPLLLFLIRPNNHNIIIIEFSDEARCLKRLRYPSACLPFQLPSDIHASDVSSAELWFYKLPDAYDSRNQTIVVSEVAHWDSNVSFQKTKPIAIKETSLIGNTPINEYETMLLFYSNDIFRRLG